MTIVKITQFTRLLCRHTQHCRQFKRSYADKILPATNHFTWNTANPVKLHMGDVKPENYPPILVQSMMKSVVNANSHRRAIVSFDGEIDWTYKQYYQQVQDAAKGFISLGKFCINYFLQPTVQPKIFF